MEKIDHRRIWGLSTAALEPELLSQNLLLGPSPWFSCCTPSGWVNMMGINGFIVEFMGIKIGFYRDFLGLRFNGIGDWRWFASALWLAGKSTILYIYSYSYNWLSLNLKTKLTFFDGYFQLLCWITRGSTLFCGWIIPSCIRDTYPKRQLVVSLFQNYCIEKKTIEHLFQTCFPCKTSLTWMIWGTQMT